MGKGAAPGLPRHRDGLTSAREEGVFGKGSKAVAAGVVRLTVTPSASASKALKTALKHREGLRVSAILTFRSSGGGPPVTHGQSLTVKLKRK